MGCIKDIHLLFLKIFIVEIFILLFLFVLGCKFNFGRLFHKVERTYGLIQSALAEFGVCIKKFRVSSHDFRHVVAAIIIFLIIF